MSTRRRRADAGWDVAEPGALKRTTCRYCGGPLPKGRRTFCSGARARFGRERTAPRSRIIVVPGSGCVHEWCLRTQPQYARKCVEARDHRVCALCSVRASGDGGWQADHTVPVAEGGGECGLEGYRTLCTDCHKKETALLRARLAARLAAQRLAAVESTP
jgi:5-methylcytosine-specific restriction protein A